MTAIDKWELIPLKELLTQRIETPDKGFVHSGLIPVVAKIGWVDGQIYLRNNQLTSTKLITIRPGDLVLSGINAAKGAIAIHDPESTLDIAATIHYLAFKIDLDRVNPWFLWWLLRSPAYQSILRRKLPQGVKSELKSNHLVTTSILLPSLDEQRRIVSSLLAIYFKLSQIDEAINAMNKNFENLPLTSLNQELHKYPQRVAFSDYFAEDLRNGMSLEVGKIGFGKTDFITVGALTKHGFNPNNIKKVDVELPGDSPYWISPNDLLISRGNSPELVGSASSYIGPKHKYAYPDLVIRIRLDLAKADINFMEWYLRSSEARNYISRTSVGTSPSMKKINQKTLNQFPIPAIDINEQSRIAESTQSIHSKSNQILNNLQDTKHKLDKLAECVVNRLCEGVFDVRVPIQAQLEAKNLECRRLKSKRLEWNKIVNQAKTGIKEQSVVESMRKIQDSQDLWRLLCQVKSGSKHPVSLTTLWVNSGIQDIDLFYTYLKIEISNGRIVERRKDTDVFLEAINED